MARRKKSELYLDQIRTAKRNNRNIVFGISDLNYLEKAFMSLILQDNDETVCEWESPVDIMDNAEFKVQCNHNPLKRGIVPNNFSFRDFKFCPFCGRKIVWK